jgi:hypothetical protein
VENNKIYQTTLMKFKLMRFRCKISFSAFMKNKTISELFFEQILASYDLMVASGEIIETNMQSLLSSSLFFDRVCYHSLRETIKTM